MNRAVILASDGRDRLRLARCAWQEIAGVDGLVVHFNGAFHSDYRQGTVARAMRRQPNLRALIITVVPTPDPLHAAIGDNAMRADYAIFTRKSVP